MSNKIRQKIAGILRIIATKEFLIVTKDELNDNWQISIGMSEDEAKRMGMFIHNYLHETGEALKEVNKIIQQNS